MKIAVIGSRKFKVEDLGQYLPEGATEIVSGGAAGIDTCAREYAVANGIKITEFLPDYARYGRGAPIRRNLQIIDHADMVLAFWNGSSRGTKHVIDICRKKNKNLKIFIVKLIVKITFALYYPLFERLCFTSEIGFVDHITCK